MSWQIESVTLPLPPRTVTVKYAAAVKSVNMPGSLPYIMSFGKQAVTMTWEGYLTDKSLVDDLADLVYKQVTVTTPDTNYNGEWILTSFTWRERGCLLYTSPSPRDGLLSRMPSSA